MWLRLGRTAVGLLAAACAAALSLAAGSNGASSPTGAGRPITLEWVGDIALSSQQGLPPGGVARALAPVRAILRDADMTIGNLEGTLSYGGVPKCGGRSSATCFAFQAPPYLASPLRSVGFDLVN